MREGSGKQKGREGGNKWKRGLGVRREKMGGKGVRREDGRKWEDREWEGRMDHPLGGRLPAPTIPEKHQQAAPLQLRWN